MRARPAKSETASINAEASMWESKVEIDIKAPVSEVYRYLADFPRHREWSSAEMSYLKQLTPGPIGVGSEFEAGETAPSRVVTFSRITAIEPNKRVAWHSWFRNLMAADWEFLLSEREGGTHVVQRSLWEPGNVGMAMFHRLVRRRQIPFENRRSLERIKAAVEQEVAVA
jgi:uncharacterized membrane protein